MVKCKYCDREMCDADGCRTMEIEFPDGTKMQPVLFGQEPDKWYDESIPKEEVRCGDCACRLGFPHHSGCDVERCPKCGGQFISCSCYGGEDE